MPLWQENEKSMTRQDLMEIVELDRNEIGQVKELWQALNAHHESRSVNFKQHFNTFTFEQRAATLMTKETLFIQIARVDGSAVGYCIASCEKKSGEIDSIYINPAYQERHIGRKLMSKAMQWLEQHRCESIMVSVAEGNEEALGYYKRFGFAKRFTVLQRFMR
jgi:ribosomal protein S18 acetylase RimI-like enzyme